MPSSPSTGVMLYNLHLPQGLFTNRTKSLESGIKDTGIGIKILKSGEYRLKSGAKKLESGRNRLVSCENRLETGGKR